MKGAGAAAGQQRWITASQSEKVAVLRSLIAKIVASPEAIELTIALPALLAHLLGAEAAGAVAALVPASLVIGCRVTLKRSGRETRLLVPGPHAPRTPAQPNPALIKAVVRGHDWWRQFQAGRSTQAIADELGLNRSYVAAVMPLAFLAPDIVSDILEGRQAPGLQVQDLTGLPPAWPAQRALLAARAG